MKIFKFIFTTILVVFFISCNARALTIDNKNQIFISKISNSMIEISNTGNDLEFSKIEILQNGKILGEIKDGLFMKGKQILFGEKGDGNIILNNLLLNPLELFIDDEKIDFFCAENMDCIEKNAPTLNENNDILVRELGKESDFNISKNNIIFHSGGVAEKTPDFCENVQINEILANSDNQFLELKNNSNENIKLNKCKIEIYNRNIKKPHIYNFTNEEIPAGGFLALDLEGGFKLSKTGLNKIIFLNFEDREIQTVEIKNSKKDASWIFNGTNWEYSYKITKNLDNISQPCEDGYEIDSNNNCEKIKKTCSEGYYLNEGSGRCNKIKEEKNEKKCEEGYFLNPNTNRCNKITPEKSSLECPDGYYRSSETNRCRKNGNTSSSKQAVLCAPGYTRNPETNRCRKNNTNITKDLTPCKDGHERSPETNRCRKIVKNNGADGKVEKSEEDSKRAEFTGWWIIGSIILVFLTILFFEFRKDIFSKISKGKK